MSVLLLPVNVAITFDPQGKEPSCLLQRAICELPVVFVCVGIANLLEVTYSFVFRHAGGVTNMLMISNAAKRRWELWHFDRQSHVACPRSLPLVNLLARQSPAVCVFVCACLLLPKITFRLLIKHQFSWQFNYKAREAQGQKRVKRVASCVDINSLQFAGHLLKTNIPHKCFI